MEIDLRRATADGRSVALICAGVALFAAWAALTPILRASGDRSSSLVHVATTDALASLAVEAEPDFALVPSHAHYDGAYFYAMALDPFATGEAHALIDEPGYRYTRPLFGWLAALISLGRPDRIPGALLGVNLAAFVASAWVLSRLAVRLGASPWTGLLVPLSPGLLIALTLDTHEPLALLVVGLATLAWLHSHRAWALVLFLVASFTREYGVLIALGLACREVLDERGGVLERVRRAAPLLAGPIVYAGWWIYLRVALGGWPVFGPGNIGLPGVGWFSSIATATTVGLADDAYVEWQLGVAMVGIDVALFIAIAITLYRSIAVPSRLRWVVAPLLVVSLSLNEWLLVFPKETFRVLAIPLIFAALTWLTPRAGAALSDESLGDRVRDPGNDDI